MLGPYSMSVAAIQHVMYDLSLRGEPPSVTKRKVALFGFQQIRSTERGVGQADSSSVM